jgi:hypothetical protein
LFRTLLTSFIEHPGHRSKSHQRAIEAFKVDPAGQEEEALASELQVRRSTQTELSPAWQAEPTAFMAVTYGMF